MFNGVSMDAIDIYNLRSRMISVSEQEPALLADTLSYNLNLDRVGLVQSNKCVLENLTNALGLKAYIESLPEQFDTVINESATNISGGEKLKISIIRAILRNPDVIILDEPTSALDSQSRAALRSYLDELKMSKIIIIISHDADFINESEDTIIIL